MRKLLLLFLLFLSFHAIAQQKDTTQFKSDANPYNILVVVDGSVYKGTVESINPQTIESVNVLRGTNPTVSFQSKSIEGVIVVTTKKIKTGDAATSVNTSNKPLIIVDDVVYEGEINDLNNKDILRVDIFKGNNAASIYGASTTNVVISITTKQYYQVHIETELSTKSKKYKQYLKRLDYLIVYKINDMPIKGNNYDIAKQIADIPEKDIVDVETKRVNYAGVNNVIVNIKTKIN